MIGLSRERMEQILNEETPEKKEPDAILRAVYTRYMSLFEKYLTDIDELDDEKIAEMKEYHEETRSLVKYYYMDIPQDVCMGIREFEKKYSDKLLGAEWHKYVFDGFAEFKEKNRNIREEDSKAEFTKQTLEAFYDVMDYVFREGFGTGSQTARGLVSGIAGLLFGKKQ